MADSEDCRRRQPQVRYPTRTCRLDRRPLASFFFGVYSWLVKVLGQFSIIYFRGLGLRVGVRVWVRVRLGLGFGLGLDLGLGLGLVWCYGQSKFRVRIRVRVGFGLGL